MGDSKVLFDRDDYNPDPADYEIRKIRDLIDLDEQSFLNSDEFDIEPAEKFALDYRYNCVGLVGDLMGSYSNYDCQINLSNEQLKVLDNKYSSQASEKNEYGEVVLRDPLLEWVPKSDDVLEVLFEAGHVLGAKDDLGKYYPLLVDANFSHGVWLGRLENAVSFSSSNTLEDVKMEMQLLRPNTYQEEFSQIMSSLFTVVTDNGYEAHKGLK